MNNTEGNLHEKEISVVSHLLKTCNERISGYTKASIEIHDQELKDLFLQFAMQTEGFTKQLLEFIKEKRAMHLETSLISEIWEAWMELKANFTKGSRTSVIEVCITGEKAAIRSYKHALKENISLNLRQIIRAQLDQIENTYKNIKHIKQVL